MSALDDAIAKARATRKLEKSAIPGIGMPNRHGPPRARRKRSTPGRSAGRQRGAPIVLPLSAYYGQSEERERERIAFYTAIAREFGDWRLDPTVAEIDASVGRDGNEMKLRRTGEAFNTKKYIDTAAAPLEYLYQKNVLADRVRSGIDDLALRSATAANSRRWEAGLRARQDFSGEMIVGIKSVDFAAIGGGGSGGGRPVADYTIDCIQSVGRLRDMMPAEDMAVLEAVVHSDRWLWKEGGPIYSADAEIRRRQQQIETRRRAPIFEAIRRALDYAALRYGLMTAHQFVMRWPAAPVTCPFVGAAVENVRRQKEREAAMALVKMLAADLLAFVPKGGPVQLNAVIRVEGDKILIDNPVFREPDADDRRRRPAGGRR